MQAKQYIGESWKHGILIIGAIVVLLPFYMMVSMSLKSQQEIQSISGGLIGAQEVQTFPVCVKTGYSEETCTTKPYIYNYWFAFEKAPIPRYLMNGVIVTLSIFIIQVLVALPCAYALSKLRFYGREFVFSMVLFCLLIPVHGIALPLYIMLAQAGLCLARDDLSVGGGIWTTASALGEQLLARLPQVDVHFSVLED